MIATCINSRPEEIYFTSGGTESDNWAIKGSMSYGDRRALITSEFEHHAVLHSCERIESLGYPVAYLHPTKEGFTTPDSNEALVKKTAFERSRRAYIVADSTKFGNISSVTFADFEDAVILTEQKPSAGYHSCGNITIVSETGYLDK